MALIHSALHKVTRTKPNGSVSLQLRADELDTKGPVVSLFEQLKLALNRSTQKQFGLFDGERSDNPLPALVEKHLAGNLGFSSITHQLMEHLKLQLETTREPFAAHLLFTVEELVEQKFVYIFWLHHSDAHYVDNELNIDNLEYIDPSRLVYALKLDVAQWQVEGWDQYLAQVCSRGNKELSDAFTLFTGFQSNVDVKAQTEQFLSAVDTFVDEHEPDNGKQLKNKIVEYCVDRDMGGNPVDVDELSSQLNGEHPKQFASFIEQQTPELGKQVYTDRASIKKYVRFFGRDKNLSISFSSDMFGEHIVFDEESDQLVVKQIPKSLKAQLARYKKRQVSESK